MSANSTTSRRLQRSSDERVEWGRSVPFFLVHLLPLAAFWTGVRIRDWIVCLILYWGRMFFITGGYHRYFSHKSYETSRVFQFLLALGGTTAAQKGPLWWSGHHRHHHRFADQDDDVHSPKKGFWWSHVGWILCSKYKKPPERLIRRWLSFPELVWLDRWSLAPPILLGAVVWWLGGWSCLWIGFFLSTVLLYHTTFFINSLAHVWGKRRYETKDTSRNSWFLAFLAWGEGWHNDHHKWPWSSKQGVKWWNVDFTFYVLWLLSQYGLVWELRLHRKEATQ